MGLCANDLSKRKAAECIYQTRNRYRETQLLMFRRWLYGYAHGMYAGYVSWLCIMTMYFEPESRPAGAFWAKCLIICESKSHANFQMSFHNSPMQAKTNWKEKYETLSSSSKNKWGQQHLQTKSNYKGGRFSAPPFVVSFLRVFQRPKIVQTGA